MTEREKVIKGLECSIGIRGCKNCDDCPYDNDFNCIGCDIVLRDAIVLLKEQEPRVLTIEEVLACNPRKEWLWFEEDAYGYIEESAMICAQFYSLCDSWCAVNIPSATHDETIEFDYEDYGKKWRCWSHRPTDEQREAVPWGE